MSVIHGEAIAFPRSPWGHFQWVNFNAQESKGVLPDESAVHISDQSGQEQRVGLQVCPLWLGRNKFGFSKTI